MRGDTWRCDMEVLRVIGTSGMRGNRRSASQEIGRIWQTVGRLLVAVGNGDCVPRHSGKLRSSSWVRLRMSQPFVLGLTEGPETAKSARQHRLLGA